MIEAFWTLISKFSGLFNREPIIVNRKRLQEIPYDLVRRRLPLCLEIFRIGSIVANNIF